MDREVLVYVDLEGTPHLAGRLWSRTRKGRETATFEYDGRWLENPARFSLEPALQLGPGPFHTAADLPMFGAIGDSAPDRWGRTLMRRMERRHRHQATHPDDGDKRGRPDGVAAAGTGRRGLLRARWRARACDRGLGRQCRRHVARRGGAARR